MHKISEIVLLAEQGAAHASSLEIKDLYGLLSELAFHAANLDLHIRRLEQANGRSSASDT